MIAVNLVHTLTILSYWRESWGSTKLSAWRRHVESFFAEERKARGDAVAREQRRRRASWWTLLEFAEEQVVLDEDTSWTTFLSTRVSTKEGAARVKDHPEYLDLVACDGSSPRELFVLFKDDLADRRETVAALKAKAEATGFRITHDTTLEAFKTALEAAEKAQAEVKQRPARGLSVAETRTVTSLFHAELKSLKSRQST